MTAANLAMNGRPLPGEPRIVEVSSSEEDRRAEEARANARRMLAFRSAQFWRAIGPAVAAVPPDNAALEEAFEWML